jgi:hypothetical protein
VRRKYGGNRRVTPGAGWVPALRLSGTAGGADQSNIQPLLYVIFTDLKIHIIVIRSCLARPTCGDLVKEVNSEYQDLTMEPPQKGDFTCDYMFYGASSTYSVNMGYWPNLVNPATLADCRVNPLSPTLGT